MKNFPMFLKMDGRRILIIGGGEQAAQKARLALKTCAEIVVVADTLDPDLAALVADGRIRHKSPILNETLFANTQLCFVATGCKGADAAWHAIAKAAGVLVNVVDYPELCEAMTPSIVDRDPVVIAIGTEGTAPVLGRQIKSRIEETLEPGLGVFASFAGSMRDAVAMRIPHKERRAFWRWVFQGGPRELFKRGNEREARGLIKEAIQTGEFDGRDETGLCVISVRDLPADLMTLRAVNRLQNADRIYYDDEIAPDILELARRDAERMILAGDPSDVSASLKVVLCGLENQNVVWLSSADVGELLQAIRGQSNTDQVETLQFANDSYTSKRQGLKVVWSA